jgi:hypothetical protein
MTARFTLSQTVFNKWRLMDNGQHIADFDSLEKAKDGIAIILKPVIYEFDENGDEIR